MTVRRQYMDRFSHNWLIKKLHDAHLHQNLRLLQGTVVDLGCGTRPYEAAILTRANCYWGIDWQATLHGLRADIAADLNKPLPIADEVADCVVTFQVIEHLAEPGVMLGEAHRILRKGGLLMLSAPFQWWVHEAPWDYQRFTRHGLEYQLRKAGFADSNIIPISGFWSMWILKLNYQLARLVRGSRILRLLIRALLVPFWWLGQTLAPLVDRMWSEDRETAGYFVIAYKP